MDEMLMYMMPMLIDGHEKQICS